MRVGKEVEKWIPSVRISFVRYLPILRHSICLIFVSDWPADKDEDADTGIIKDLAKFWRLSSSSVDLKCFNNWNKLHTTSVTYNLCLSASDIPVFGQKHFCSLASYHNLWILNTQPRLLLRYFPNSISNPKLSHNLAITKPQKSKSISTNICTSLDIYSGYWWQIKCIS